MSKRILIIGQCTLHWGRMEFGNIGNYYIVNSMFNQMRRVFPNDIIVTTMQFSKEFCDRFRIETLPMELYYNFNHNDNLYISKKEYDNICNNIYESEYVNEVKKADVVIDFSGDIWGDNADFIGRDRFLCGLYKDLIAQYMRPTVMFSGSPGPFENQKDVELVKRVYKGFNLVINRENISTVLLKEKRFDTSKTKVFPCPSFLFEAANEETVQKYVEGKNLFEEKSLKIGVILCGWNFMRGPYNVWPRVEDEYACFVEMIENLINKYHAHIYLMSHSNGFIIPPAPFELIHGRDYPIAKQLKEILEYRGYSLNVTLLDSIYTPEVTKGIISKFDVLISGRMHGGVAGLSQNIPTIIIDYGHEPKAHKLQGFAEMAGIEEYIADPNDLKDMLRKTEICVENREKIREFLLEHMIQVKQNVKDQFDCLKEFVYKG